MQFKGQFMHLPFINIVELGQEISHLKTPLTKERT